jgi:hypothetical protein
LADDSQPIQILLRFIFSSFIVDDCDFLEILTEHVLSVL